MPTSSLEGAGVTLVRYGALLTCRTPSKLFQDISAAVQSLAGMGAWHMAFCGVTGFLVLGWLGGPRT